ncbi:MAG: sigma 54-interacting transcriptional regulator [Thermoanaerobaculia bacterium]|nr:sigma 54-interacting transcriptional regulator [Thermoanaerobaculia bacterium]
MPFRLLLQFPTGSRRAPLAAGETILGSATDCDIVISHMTVSRRHARLRVADDTVWLEDLGSSNGTRVAGVRVTAAVPLAPGVEIELGGLRARLEAVDEADCVAVGPAPVAAHRAVTELAPAYPTLRGVALEEFLLRTVPAAVDRWVAGASAPELAQSFGSEIFRAFPCPWLEISHAPTGALWFHGGREGETGSPDELAADLDRVVGRVRWRSRFVSPVLARQLEPLVDMVLRLVSAADERGAGPAIRAPKAVPPASATAPTCLHHATLDVRLSALLERCTRVARGDIGVLIRGESGTGKEVLARYVHDASPVARGPFVAINCAALPRDLLEAELFGIERAVATGVEARPGKFESAHGGTLFLDEIGDMALETQAKILRVLQEGEVFRIGAQTPRPARPRIVAATHRDLEGLLEAGTFRRDLFYRIAGFVAVLPALRERAVDIPNLAANFLTQAAQKHGLAVAGLSRRAAERLAAYDWPGNIRELKHEVERAALFLSDGELLDSTGLDPRLARHGGGGETLHDRLEAFERTEIERALGRSGGDVARAAAALGIGRSTLYRRLQALGISVPETLDR